DARIELAQRPRRAVARVGQHLAAFAPRAFVPGLEGRARHVHLAANLEHARPVLAAQAQRNRLDRAQVRTDVLALLAVAARRAAHEPALLVAQADRKAVELGLDRKYRFADVLALLDAAHELLDFLVAERIREREHR